MLRKTGYRTSGVYEVGIKYESDRNERVSVKTSGEFLGRDRSGNDDFKYRSIERIAWTGDFFQPESYKKNEAIDEKWKRSYTNQVIQSGKTVIAIDTSEYVASTRTPAQL